MNFSRNKAPFPKAASASDVALLKFSSTSLKNKGIAKDKSIFVTAQLLKIPNTVYINKNYEND